MYLFWIKLILWISLFLVFYTYVGYGMILFLAVKIKRVLSTSIHKNERNESHPAITYIVCAFNEENWIRNKIENGLRLDYPKEKIHFLFVTDGSSDNTEQIIKNYPFPPDTQWSLHHQPERKGKIAAFHRIMQYIKTPIVISTDANTIVNTNAIKVMVAYFRDSTVGAVAGEKRVLVEAEDAANSAGEGFYWKYESQLKKWDAELWSVVGAAGELFAFKTELYEPVPSDTIIEDFFLTLRIAQKGYRVMYAYEAYAAETASASIEEELKRKVRIAAGGIQSIVRLSPLLNIFKYGTLSFQYISHRVLRWTLAPLALPIIFVANLLLVFQGAGVFYMVLLWAQIAFYLAALIGYLLATRKIKVKALFIPFYFCVMNYAVYAGFLRYMRGKQSVVWEKAQRAEAKKG